MVIFSYFEKLKEILNTHFKDDPISDIYAKIMSTTKGKGGHIGFSTDPVGVGVHVGVGVTESCTHGIS